jgi:ubiquinone/menaquinone biosynthesis C-methylase UbiE
VTYTHGHAESVLRSHRWRTAENSCAYLLPYLRAGATLLDVGAGPGTITADLARRVAPGEVTALEATEAAADLTRVGLSDAGLTGVEVATGDAHTLPFNDHSFDIVHAHQVLQHVADPVRVMTEMIRVLKPGGIVGVRETDFRGHIWSPADPLLDRWLELYLAAHHANGGDPEAGRHLLGWAQKAGWQVLTATSSTWCFATPEDRLFWGGMWADRVEHSALSEQLIAEGRATPAELSDIGGAWRAWAGHPDGWLSALHGELVATK